ncbi:MAG TPA: dienelactone hydrolase family protein [Balneolales bacterium]|nr:dienelactone hydrolase family protein [Balneolales bacterium]
MLFLLLFTLTFPFYVTSVDSLPRGIVIDSVSVSGATHQSYALYLPSNYDSAKSWPVLFGLDPAARGRKPVDIFSQPAKQFDYIIAGSNDAQNGPINKILPAVYAMMRDVKQKFHIDKKRIYLTGFSGGSRLASYIASQNPDIAGIIACGAGLQPNLKLSPDPKFSYVSTVGNADMNFIEMKELYQTMNKMNWTHHMIIFNGTHQWPDSASANEAIRWLQLDAMRRELMPIDTNFIQRFYAFQIQKANFYENEQKYVDAYRTLQQIIHDFDTFPFVYLIPIRKRIKSLESSRYYRKDQRKEQKIRDEEDERMQTYLSAYKTILNVRFDRTDQLKSQNWWKKQIQQVQKLKESDDPDYALLGKRLEQFMKAHAYEYHRFIEDYWKDYHRLVWMDQVFVLLYPKSRQVRYLLARSLILDHQTQEGLETLKKAVDLGYHDYHNLNSNPDFKSVRSHPEFQKILGVLKPMQ